MVSTELLFKLTGDPSNLKGVLAQARAEIKQTAQVSQASNRGELSMKQQLAAAAALQRQRSAALISQWKQQEREAGRLAQGIQPVATNLQRITDVMQTLARSTATVQGPLGGVAGRLSSLGSIAGEASGKLGVVGVAILAVVVAASAATVAITKLTVATSEAVGRMHDLSQATGIQVETLSALQILARTTGGDVESLAVSLGIFQRNLEEAKDPTSKAAELLRKLGVTADDTEGALRQTLAGINAMAEGSAKTTAALDLFGRGGRQFLAILKEANGDIDLAIKQFRALGGLIDSDTARAADKLNDQLALLEFQFRGLAVEATTELIPAFVDIVKSLSELVRAVRPVIHAFGELAGPVARSAAKGLEGLSIAIAAVTQDYRALAEAAKRAHEETAGEIPPISVSGPQPSALPPPLTTQESLAQAARQAESIVAAAKRAADKLNQDLAESFEKGRIKREQEAEGIIAGNKRVLDSERERVRTAIDLKQEEIKSLEIGSKEYKKAHDDVEKLQQDLLNKESEFQVQSQAIRQRAGKERADSLRNEEKNRTEILSAEFDRQIKLIEERQKREGALAGLDVIEQLEQAKINVRRESLEEQKRIGFLTVDQQREIDDQLRALGQEADLLDENQKRRRIQRELETAQRLREIKIGELDTAVQLLQISGERQIAIIRSLANRRVVTEEEAARKITKIHLDLIDQEIEATKAKLKSAAGISDKDERVRVEADLNSQLKILGEQRKSIQTQGNQEIEEGRQEDLGNERRYADDLLEIRRRVAGVEGEAARIGINLLILNHARRRDVLRAQIALELQEENDRHRQRVEAITQERADNAASNRTQEEKNKRKEELNRLEEAEAERHRLAMQEITGQGRKDEAEESPIGRALGSLGTGQIPELTTGIQEFADVATVALGSVFAAVGQLSRGVGELVSQWVLMGTTGPNAFRKLAATILASVAQQAATLAIMSLAYAALATTAVGAILLGGTPAQFLKAAALFGAVALVTAGIGRAVAGNSFATGNEGAAGGPQQPQQPERDRTIRERRTGGGQEFARREEGKVEVTLKLDSEVLERVIVKRFQRNGQLRSTLRNDLLNEAGA